MNLLFALATLGGALADPVVEVHQRGEPVVDQQAALFTSVTGEAVPCTMRVTLDHSGEKERISPLRCPASLVESATQTIQRWIYLPPLEDGMPVAAVHVPILLFSAGEVVVERAASHRHQIVPVRPWATSRWEVTALEGEPGSLRERCVASFGIDGQGLPIDLTIDDCPEAAGERLRRGIERWGFEVVGNRRDVRFRMELPVVPAGQP